MSVIKWRKDGGLMPTFPTFSGIVEDFFRDDDNFFPTWRNRLVGGFTVPAVNIRETKDQFMLEVAAPGLKKDDFVVEVDNGMLVVRAEKSVEKEDKGDDYTRQEFSYESFRRSFWLPENVNSDAIKATYKNGILNIALPKTEIEEPHMKKMIKIA